MSTGGEGRVPRGLTPRVKPVLLFHKWLLPNLVKQLSEAGDENVRSDRCRDLIHHCDSDRRQVYWWSIRTNDNCLGNL